MITLFRKNQLGVGTWRIWATDNVINMAHANVVGGSEVYHTEEVKAGLAGRSMAEQIESRIKSRVNRQMDKGYVDSLQEATTAPLTNMLAQPLPMLAKKYSDLPGWVGKGVVQPKLNGYRCLVTRNSEGQVICYTRQGKLLTALGHIAEAIHPHLPDGIILDGEIYTHGVPLQVIASLAKRYQPQTSTLVYNVYDSISPDSFPHRYAEAREIVEQAWTSSIVMVKNQIVATPDQAWNAFAEYRSMGYEGAMLRTLNTRYESGTRSSSLLKLKSRFDDEYRVVDVVPGEDGLGILVCQMVNGKKFKTLAPGNHDQKRFIYVHKDQYIGRKVTVEYAELTNDGIPFHCVATGFRSEL